MVELQENYAGERGGSFARFGVLISGKGGRSGMRVMMTSAAAWAGRINEDFVGALPTAAVLVDGAGIPGTESICRHGVAWYASRLGSSLLGLLAFEPDRSLSALLADAIGQVTDGHRDTCDVADPISPSATVAILRFSGDLVEYLVLGDSVVVLDRVDAEPLVATDPREVVISRSYEPAIEAAIEGSDEHHRLLRDLRASRNRLGGFWVARTIRGRRTRLLPEIVALPSGPGPLCSATEQAASWTSSR